jgi:uncharacterized protein YrrD
VVERDMPHQFVPCQGAELSLRLDARVYARDEAPLGFVHWVVLETPGFQVSGLAVAEPGVLARQVLVAPGDIEAVAPTGDALRLRVDRHEFEALPDHTADDYVPPAPSWSDALRLGLGASAYVATESHAGAVRAAIRKGDVVTDSTGQRLGTIEALCLDRGSGRLAAIIAKSARGRGPSNSKGVDWKLPAEWVARVGEDRVYLSVDADTVERSSQS